LISFRPIFKYQKQAVAKRNERWQDKAKSDAKVLISNYSYDLLTFKKQESSLLARRATFKKRSIHENIWIGCSLVEYISSVTALPLYDPRQ
jgi:hypothetical protein